MMTFTALILIILLYIIPLNNIVYIWSESIANYIISMPQIKIPDIKIIQIIAFLISKNINVILTSIIYVLIVIYIFAILRFFIYILQRVLYIKKDKDIYEKIDFYMEKYNKGLNSLNLGAKLIITIMIIVLSIFKIYDIRIYVLAIFLVLFGFKNFKKKEVKHIKTKAIDKRYKKVKNHIKEENIYKYRNIKWKYNIDPLGVEEPISFEAKIIIGYKKREEVKLNNYDYNRCIYELANQIDNACKVKELTNKQRIAVVFSLFNSIKILEDDKSFEGIIEILTLKRSNEEEIIKCIYNILTYMKFEVEELKEPLNNGRNKSVLAVSGADSEEGDHYYTKNNKKYYYCEILNSGDFYIGENKKENNTKDMSVEVPSL